MPPKPRVFIGSSTEALPIAEVVQLELQGIAHCTVWTQDFFKLGRSVLETLCKDAAKFQFAILIFNNDDVVSIRGTDVPAARANVVFELGLFMGMLGRDRALALVSEEVERHLPSDFAGITTVSFSADHPDGLRAALGPSITRLKEHLRSQSAVATSSNETLEVVMPRLYRVLMQSVSALRAAGGDPAALDRAAAEMFSAVSTEVWGAGEPMSDELILDVEGQLQDCQAILATDVLGPTAWLKPIAYRYLALQIRAYLRRNIVNDSWNLLLSESLASGVARALLRTPQVTYGNNRRLTESLTQFDNDKDFLWAVGAHRLQFSRVLLWTREELLGTIAESVIAVHESFHVPLFALVVPDADARREYDFILFQDSHRRDSGWCNARIKDGFRLRRLQNGRVPFGDAPRANDIFESLLAHPALLFAKDARHLLENGADLASGSWPVTETGVRDFLRSKGLTAGPSQADV